MFGVHKILIEVLSRNIKRVKLYGFCIVFALIGVNIGMILVDNG